MSSTSKSFIHSLVVPSCWYLHHPCYVRLSLLGSGEAGPGRSRGAASNLAAGEQ